MLAKHHTDRTPAAFYPLSAGYVLDNAAPQAVGRLAALSELFDPGTIRHLEERGVASGWHCLEVGGGDGSIASWLSDRVGPAGRVVATDINTCFLDNLKRPNLEVRQCNVMTGPLPEAAFDLVHVRLVLTEHPERDAVLACLFKALKPGGWLLDEEFHVLSLQTDPAASPCDAPLHALKQLLAQRRVDLRFGRLLYGRLRALGLVEIGGDARLSAGTGGSVVARLIRCMYEQLRDTIIEAGHITVDELEQDLRTLDNPDSLLLTPMLWAAWGRRPPSAPYVPDAKAFLGAGI